MKDYFSLVKFSHTIFALPFALVGFFLGIFQTQNPLQWRLLGLVLLCMVSARSAAMAFNRYLDRDIDAMNSRTAMREIPSGSISPSAALLFVFVNCALFVAAAAAINKLCFALSPLALLIILGYSYTKRFTVLCHFVLGLGLALAPLGAYLAVGGGFDAIPLLYSATVLLWVSGFDIVYALQDEQFDRKQALHSIPVFLGTAKAISLAEVLHILCAVCLISAAYLQSVEYGQLEWLHWCAVCVFIALLMYQHQLIKPNDLSRINLAFFTTNGMASLLFGFLVILDFYI